MFKIRFAVWILSFGLMLLYAALGSGQDYPNKPIRLVLGFPPGGGVDVVARLISPKLSEQLGQQLVIDNRGGAAGNIALDLVAKAAPDGYSLILSTPSITVNPALYSKVHYDPVNDFLPVTLVGTTALMLIVHPSLPVKSVKELITLAKAKPGQLSYSSGGNGSVAHLSYELFKSMTGVEIMHVPYKGAMPAQIGVMSGEAQLTFGALASALPHVKSGKLRALAVTSAQRSIFLPDLPTVGEAGVPGYESTQWYGLLAPARTPAAIITKLHSAMIKVLGMAEVKASLSNSGVEVITSTPEQFSAYLKSECAKWNKIIKESGMRIE